MAEPETERRVVITGGSGGLGLCVCRAFVAQGAHLTVPVVNEAQRTRLESALADDMARVQTPLADLRREDDVRAVLPATNPPDAVVHLVGGFAMGPLHDAALATFEQQWALNVTTTFMVLKHALAAMRPRGRGRIVTVSSRVALQPTAQMGIYAAAKAAVLALTQTAAEETRGTDITANAVLPSVIDTPANRAAMGEDQTDDWVSPDRLAQTIAFLCSDAAGDLRGTAIRAYASA